MTESGDPFAGTAAAYAHSRPGYGHEAIGHVADRFDLDAHTRLLDLGCGAGQLAVPLAARAGSVVAMDPNEAMCRATRERASRAGRSNVEIVLGSDADLRGGMIDDLTPLDLTTMGRSLHWMDERATLECLREHTRSAGGVAIVDDVEWLTAGDEPWMAAVYDVVAEYVATLPERYDPDAVEYDDPWDELLTECGFQDVETVAFTVEREWPIEQIVEYVLSLSFASSDRFGDDLDSATNAIDRRLRTLGDEPFEQHARVSVLSGRVSHS
ncbi:class I SAM-dependent methyltransferase [Salinarchaeum laminariae]|uniref:class I SAM-dependent methyltransferase n=1 Tax=Salinarchaeum laminariae TaxID=869888 RepID=UPI0020BDC404|nr:methyltransferase domain-containing protein [Salinarchaeum laminariae]